MAADPIRRWTALALAVAMALIAIAAPRPATAGDQVTLQRARWTVNTPLGDAHGVVAVIQAADGRWRCDVLLDEGQGTTADDVLERRGRGWTLTGHPEGGVVQPWGEPWRTTGPALAEALAEVLADWSGGPWSDAAAVGAPRRWRTTAPRGPRTVVVPQWTDLPAAWRPESHTAPTGGALKRRLTGRGRGRGDDGGVLRLSPGEGGLLITSSRLPGTLRLDWPVGAVTDLPDEAFLPLWPLADLLP